MILRYTHIILDEIHERSTDADFALIIVRKLVAASENLKVVIMSATMEGHTIASYFEQAINFTEVADPYFVGAKRYKVEQYFIDELDHLVDLEKSVWSEWQATALSNLKRLVLQQPPENLQEALSRRPAVTLFAQNACTELIISQANLGEQILVFLPGISEISTYYDMLTAVLEVRDIQDHFSVFVMHSQVPFEDQKEVFKPPPPYRARVILATNIAESSITLPKLRMVINFGIYRQLEYNSKRHMSQLTKKWCSQASCAQRAGRAGRVFEGVAVHLFTKRFYWVIIPEFDSPEILHAPLAKLVLQAKQIGSKMGIPLPSEFLSQAVDPPSLEQMELALQELASFGAIVSQPGSPVSEEAEITLLGRFALTLPLDIEFSRLVLYGIFFGIPTDAIVIAAAASLSQDVFSLPTRMVIKEDSVYSESLKRSMRARRYFDGGQYSDPVMACNLFREWMDYRNCCAVDKSLLTKHSFLRMFCNNRAVRWQRLLLLEHSVAEIASRVLSHVPLDYHLYEEVRVLSDITRYRRGFSFMSELEESCGNGRRQRRLRLTSVTLHFCDNINTIKALLAASFSHNFIIGHRGLESPTLRERRDSCHALSIMSNLSYDPSESVTLKSDSKSASVQDVQHLVSTVLPHRYCEAQLVDRTWYVHLHPEFSNNPKTALMRAQVTDQNRSEPQTSLVGDLLTDDSVIQQKLSLDMCYFWQYGERRPLWKVANTAFTKPRHPMVVNWTRISKERESVIFSEWRNPSGFICDVGLECPLFLGVVSTMQGIQHRNAVAARGVTVLPSLSNGREALLMLLAFQSQGVKVDFIVSKNMISCLMIDSVLLPLPMAQLERISANDLVLINELRGAMSKVMKTNMEGGSCLFPMEEISTIHSLLKCVLKGTLSNLTTPLEQSCLPTKTGVVSQQDDKDDDADSEFDFDQDVGEEEITLDSFQFYPPLKCTLLDAVTYQSIPLESLELEHLFQKKTSSGGIREKMSSFYPSSEAERVNRPGDIPQDLKQQQQLVELEQQEQSIQSDKLLESAQMEHFLEPSQLPMSSHLPMSDELPMPDQLPMSDQMPISDHLPMPDQLPTCMSDQLLTAELYYQQQQLLEQHEASFRLSPLAEPFVPTNVSTFDPTLTSPLLMAPHSQEAQGSLPFHNVHNQDPSVQIQNVQPSTLQNISDFSTQSIPVSKVQDFSVQSASSASFSGASFRGRRQPKSRNSSNVVNRPPCVEPCPDYHGTQMMVPPLAASPFNLQPNYQSNLISIIFHLLDKASCKPAGEGELEVQKAKLLCQTLMLASSTQPHPGIPRPPPQSFTQHGQSQHNQSHLGQSFLGQSHHGLPPEHRPHRAVNDHWERSGSSTVQTVPATACLVSEVSKNKRETEPRSKEEDASSSVYRKDKLGPRTALSCGLTEGRHVCGESVEEAAARPLQSPTTGLVEEHSEDQKSLVDVTSGTSGVDISVTVVPPNDDEGCQVTAEDVSKNILHMLVENLPLNDVDGEQMEGQVAGGHLKTRKDRILTDATSTEEAAVLNANNETRPVHEGTPSSIIDTSPSNSQGTLPIHSLPSTDVLSSNIEASSASSLAENMADVVHPTTSPICSQDITMEAQGPVSEAPNANSVQEAIINQGGMQGLTEETLSVSHLQENKTPSPTSSPQRDSVSPIATAASSLSQTEQPKSQRHLSDPPAVANRGLPKMGTSQLAQALLSPHHYPLHQSFPPPVSLSQLVAQQSNRPFSAFLSPPKRPSLYEQCPVPGAGFLYHSAPTLPSHIFDTAHQIRPSASYPSLSNGRSTRSLDFSTLPSQPASVPPHGVCSPPNGALLAMTAAVSNGVPQRPHPPPPGFTVPPQSPYREGQRSPPLHPPPPGFTVPPHEVHRLPPTGAQATCVLEATIPPQLPMQPPLSSSSTIPAPPLFRLIKVKDLSATVSDDGLLAAPQTFLTPPPPPHGHEQNHPVVMSCTPISMPPPPNCGRVSQGRRMPHHARHAKPLLRYHGPPPYQPHGASNGALPPPPPGLGWPLPPPPPPPSHQRRRGKVPPPPPSPHPDLIMNYTARHKIFPLMPALIPNPLHYHVQNYQASGLHVQPLQYNRCTNNNKKERSVPSHEEFGIPGEQLMQYYCTMLATKGRDLELNLLCGPYYRDLLKCYKVCARENEVLSPCFFEKYSCFTVYGESGRYLVRLNPATEEGLMTDQSSTSSDMNDTLPPNAKGGEELTVRNGGDNKGTTTSSSLVREEQSVVPLQEVSEEKSVATTTVSEEWGEEDEEKTTQPLTSSSDTDHSFLPIPTMPEVTSLAEAGVNEDIQDVPQPVTGGDEVEVEEKQSDIHVVAASSISEVTQPTESSTMEDSDINAQSGVEVEEKQPLISVSTVAEATEPTEDWDVVAEPATSGDTEQDVEEKQPLNFVASVSEVTQPAESSTMEGQDDIANPVTMKEENEENESRIPVIPASLTSDKEDWDVIPEQLPSASATADKHISREVTPASSGTGYDEDCWIEGEQPTPSMLSGPELLPTSSQLEPEGPKIQASATTVFDEDCWEENVVPECVNIKRIESKPIRILKREEPPKCDEPIGVHWRECKPTATSHPPAHSKGATDSGGDRQESGAGGGRKYKNKRKRKGKQGQQDDRRGRFSPAPQAEATNTLGGRGEQSSSSRDSYRGHERRYYLNEVKQRFKGERDARDGSSDSFRVSKEEDSNKESGDSSSTGGRWRQTREYRRGWGLGSAGRPNKYSSGWSQDKRQEQQDQSGKK